MNLAKRIKQLEATVQEQEATILHLRTANSVLSAKLVQKRRRKPVQKSTSTWVPGMYGIDPVRKKKPLPKRTTVRDEHGVLKAAPSPKRRVQTLITRSTLDQLQKIADNAPKPPGLRVRDQRGALRGMIHG